MTSRSEWLDWTGAIDGKRRQAERDTEKYERLREIARLMAPVNFANMNVALMSNHHCTCHCPVHGHGAYMQKNSALNSLFGGIFN